MAEHRLVLIDRSKRDGVRHRHRYQATCPPCEWSAVPVRRKDDAEERYRDHVSSEERVEAAHARRTLVRPREPTPIEELPEELRPC